jgi:chromosome segregation ATPase
MYLDSVILATANTQQKQTTQVEVIREIEVEKIVEVEPVGLRTQLESCIEERELLRKQRHELEVERDQVRCLLVASASVSCMSAAAVPVGSVSPDIIVRVCHTQHLKQYQDTREELTAMASEASTLKAELSSLQQERALLATDVEHAAASLTAKTAQFAELKATKEGADLEIESLKQQLAAAGDAEKDVAAKLAVVENEEEALKRDLAATETMLGKMKERCDCADAALEASNKQLGQLEERYAASVAELARAEEGLRAETEARSKLEGQYDATLKDFQEQMLRTAERDEEIQALLQDKKDLEVEAQQLRASLSEAEAAAVAGNDERLVLQDKLAAAEARLEQVASRVEVLEVEKAEGMQAQQDLVVLQGQLQAAKDDLKRLQATESDSARAAQKTTDEVRLLTEKLEKCEVVALETSASHASAIRTVKEQLLEALAERKSARSASVELTAALEEKEQHVARLEAELAEGREASQEEVRLLAEKLEKCEAEVVVLKEQLLGAQAEANGARSASVELTTALEEKGQRVVRLENELEKAATRVVYEQVIKEVEVPVIREVVKEVEVIKEVYLPAVQTTSIPGPSRLRTFAKVAAVVALGASAIVTSVALMDNGTCPVPKWNYGVGHPLVQASRGVRRFVSFFLCACAISSALHAIIAPLTVCCGCMQPQQSAAIRRFDILTYFAPVQPRQGAAEADQGAAGRDGAPEQPAECRARGTVGRSSWQDAS